MKLELKHLAPYLPYGLTAHYIQDQIRLDREITLYNVMNYIDKSTSCMPILRPLSDFNSIGNELDLTTNFDGSYYTGADDVAFINTSDKTYLTDMITVNEFMFANHFDVFGLIPSGLAIDINTI